MNTRTKISSASDYDGMRVILGFAILAASLSLGACGGSSGSSGGITPPPVDPADPPDAPQNVQVVAGDGYDSEVSNTISWTADPDVTSYTVYWSNVPGVTESSSVLVPSAAGLRYAIHSDVDVIAGSACYYRVQATSATGTSALSVEVSGTPEESITNNSLNDVAWNGVDMIVAVGDSGTILTTANAVADGWSDVSAIDAPQSLSAVTWEGVNSQFLIVGAGSTVLSGDGVNWVREDLSSLSNTVNLEDVAWLGDRYIAVGNAGTILTSNTDGSAWVARNAGAGAANTVFSAVAFNGARIVVVGTNGTILNSPDGVTWTELPKPSNNDLNDVTWDGSRFVVVGSNDTILTSPDGEAWEAHVPGTSDINFVAVTQWENAIPQDPVVGTVGSAGTFVISPDADPGTIVPAGTTEQLGGITWVDDGMTPAYFVMVGNDGSVLTNQHR